MSHTPFIKHTHFIPLAAEKVANILGWDYQETYDEAYDLTDREIVDHKCESHLVRIVEGEEQCTIISIAPGLCMRHGTRQITETFGNTFLPQSRVTAVLSALDAIGFLTKRTVLVEAGEGDEIWGEATYSGSFLRIVRADGLIINTLDETDSHPVRGEKVKLTVKSYWTIADKPQSEIEKTDFEAVKALLPTDGAEIPDLLCEKALGRVHVWGVLEGPMMISQSVCFDDETPYHVAPEGFIGQFRPAGTEASLCFIAHQEDGDVRVSRHAL